MPDEAHAFGLRLRTLMKAKGIRQADISRATGIDPMTVNRYCHGKRLPRVRNMRKLARFIGCRWEDLLGL